TGRKETRQRMPLRQASEYPLWLDFWTLTSVTLTLTQRCSVKFHAQLNGRRMRSCKRRVHGVLELRYGPGSAASSFWSMTGSSSAHCQMGSSGGGVKARAMARAV